MTYEKIARDVTSYLNSLKELDKFNDVVTYELEHWYCGVQPSYHQAAIYKHCRGDAGVMCWTNATYNCTDFETACGHMLRQYFNNKITFSSPEELKLKLAIRGEV